MTSEEIYYTIALTRMTGFNQQMALQLYQALGSGKAVYDHRHDIGDVMPDATPRLREAMKNWDDALHRAAAEMEFITKNSIRVLALGDEDYPQRLCECPDAPLLLYYKGNADLNQRYILNIVGTRHCTTYGQDIIRRFIADLRKQCPQVLVVSGLAYGIDVCAHRNALENGYETVGVLAHGLDQIYPYAHRDIANQMVAKGGLLTEYMSQTEALPNNFRQRNRIVAGMSDATIVVESAETGGALITSADDFLETMGWQTEATRAKAVATGIERQLFPELTEEEKLIVTQLQQAGDLQQNMLSVRTNLPIGRLNALLFQLEMKGIVRPLAGGSYHLLA